MFFSAKGQQRAAVNSQDMLERYRRTGEDQITSYGGQALSALGQGGDSARRAMTSYGGVAYDDASRGFGDASTQLNMGRAQANTYLDAARGYFDPYQQQGQAAQTMYSNALGLNGADGNAQARSAFQTSPGYQFQLDQATQAGQRQAAATGRLDGGGTLAALTSLGSGLANQEYNNYLNRLQGQGQMGFNAAQAMGNNLGQQANLQYQQGAGQAQIAQDRGRTLAGINSGLGASMAQSLAGQGAGEAQLYGNMGNSLASLTGNTAMAHMKNINDVGQANDAARAGNINLGMGLAGTVLGAGLGGGRTVGGSLFSGLGKMFGG